MSEALIAVAALSLLLAGLAHTRAPDPLRKTLARHAVLPGSLQAPVAASLVLVEIALGAGLLVGLSLAHNLVRGLSLAAALLFAAMAGYVHIAARRAPATALPCGCGFGEAPLGLWMTVRAGLLAVLSGLGALTTDVSALQRRPAPELVIMLAATVALTIAITALPAARATGVAR